MSKQLSIVVMCCMLLGMILPSFARDGALLGLWNCNEGEKSVVSDASGNGRDGVFAFGDPTWTAGVDGSTIELISPTLVEVSPLDIELSEATMAGWIKPYGPQPNWASLMMMRGTSAHGLNIMNDFELVYHWNSVVLCTKRPVSLESRYSSWKVTNAVK